MNKSKLEKGNGEFLGFAIVSVFIAFLIIFLTAFIQHFYALTDMSKAISVVARSAAVCMSMDDAREQAQAVAESAITNPNIDNITVDVNYAGDSSDWISGAYLTVTLKADVHTIDPYVTSGSREKTMLVTVENLAAGGSVIYIPEGMGDVFTYMGWQLITADSPQRNLRNLAGQNFDEEGFGIIDGRYVIACTNTFGQIGDYIDFYLENGLIIHTVMGDEKNQSDALCNQYGHLNGRNVVEFIVDRNTWYGVGHHNPGTRWFHPEWNSRVVKAVNLGRNYFNTH